MKKSEWSDEQLEELLRQMPKIQDNRNPRDIYQNLSRKNRRQPAWLIPAFAIAAALLLFILLIPKFMIGDEFALNGAREDKSSFVEKAVEDNDTSISMNKSPVNEGKSGGEQEFTTATANQTALYDHELGNGKVLNYWIPDSQAQIIIPVSIIVNSDEGNWLSLLNKSMGALTEEDWGLMEYYPLNATLELSADGTSVTVDVPSDHLYGQGSASETLFITVLKNLISSNSDIQKIYLSTNSEPGIEFSNYGPINEIDIDSVEKVAYFLYTPTGIDKPFIVPSPDTFTTIEEAFEAMYVDIPDLGLTASLLPSFLFKDITIDNNRLILTMDDNTKMSDTEEILYSFEALLLTAKSFGINTVLIKNAPISQIGPFDLSAEIKVPVAANYRTIQ
ncbi:hypothetical protein [Neobacillus sp. FSL H8-0543]|uniref:hypothetical protein n=1 Tax=Neobacillus sp. FSL H8-0543 TaxID=2954672 RepID=UPI0031590960